MALPEIEVVAISSDRPDQTARHQRRDRLSLTLLADPEHRVIRQFGLLHRRGLIHATRTVFGVPIGVPTGYRRLAIPTTLLVDESGVIRWIDQARDYRVRSDDAVVRAAIASAFGDS